MDMFDFSSIVDLMKIEPGHGLLQSVLLFMIWWQSKGLRKEIAGIKDSFHDIKSLTDIRFEKVEQRLNHLEGVKA